MNDEREMKWFGPYSWGAPICFPPNRTGIPVGKACFDCEGPIEVQDRGFILSSGETVHYECFMRGTLGPEWEKIIGEVPPV